MAAKMPKTRYRLPPVTEWTAIVTKADRKVIILKGLQDRVYEDPNSGIPPYHKAVGQGV
jgi:hypothetical protein